MVAWLSSRLWRDRPGLWLQNLAALIHLSKLLRLRRKCEAQVVSGWHLLMALMMKMMRRKRQTSLLSFPTPCMVGPPEEHRDGVPHASHHRLTESCAQEQTRGLRFQTL